MSKIESKGRLPVDDALGGFVSGLLDGSARRGLVVPTGFEQLDRELEGGLRRGQVALVAGRTGVGTSIFALNIAHHASVRQSRPTVFIAPDSAHDEVLARMASAEAKVPVSHVRGDRLSEMSLDNLRRKQDVLRAAPIYISCGHGDASTSVSLPGQIESWVAYGLQLAVLDGTALSGSQTQTLITSLKLLVQRCQIAIVLTAKALPPSERIDLAPHIEDVRDFDQIGDLLDLVIVLHRDDLRNPDSYRPGEADIEVVKHRYGPPRRLTVTFQGHYARFVDMAPMIDPPRLPEGTNT